MPGLSKPIVPSFVKYLIQSAFRHHSCRRTQPPPKDHPHPNDKLCRAGGAIGRPTHTQKRLIPPSLGSWFSSAFSKCTPPGRHVLFGSFATKPSNSAPKNINQGSWPDKEEGHDRHKPPRWRKRNPNGEDLAWPTSYSSPQLPRLSTSRERRLLHSRAFR